MFSKISSSTLLAFISFIAVAPRGVQAPKNEFGTLSEADRLLSSSLQDIVQNALECDVLKWVRLFTNCDYVDPQPERKFWEDQTCKHLETHKCAVGLMMTTLCGGIDKNKIVEWIKTIQKYDGHKVEEMEQQPEYIDDQSALVIGGIELCFPVPQQGKIGKPFRDATEAQLAGAQPDMMFHKIKTKMHVQASKPVAKELFDKIVPIFDNYGLLLHVNLDSIVHVDPCFGNIVSVDGFKGISAFALDPIPHTTPIPAWAEPVEGFGFVVHFINGAPTPIKRSIHQKRDGLLYTWDANPELGDAGRGTPLYIEYEGTFYLAGIQARYYVDGRIHQPYNVYYPLHEEQ